TSTTTLTLTVTRTPTKSATPSVTATGPTPTRTSTATRTQTPTATSTGTAQNSCTLRNNLISYWRLDEASGNAIDAIGTNTLIAHNAPGTTTGIVNGARTFNGNIQYFSIASNSSVENAANDFTFTAWGYLTDKTDYRTLVGKLTENYSTHIRDY